MSSDKPTPRTSDGHPDLSGIWGNVTSLAGRGTVRARPGSLEFDQAVLQRGAGWDKPLYRPEFWAKVRSLDRSRIDVDPVWNCNTPGVPRQNAPDRIIQKNGDEIVMFNGSRARIIPVDGQQLTAADADESTADGIPAGHWDGDKLIVESVGFDDKTWLQWQGYFHTDRMKVTERFWRQGDLLFYNFTVDDPDVLMEPWTQYTLVRKLAPNQKVRFNEEKPCEITPVPEAAPYMRG